MSTSPGTSPNQARNSRFAAGKDKMGSAPASSISRLTDQIHRPVLASALRTLPLSAGHAVTATGLAGEYGAEPGSRADAGTGVR